MAESHPALDDLHAETPVRVWSLIVTIVGDIVMRGGRETDPPPLATANLQNLLGLLRIDANAMRAALSRLTAAGTLVRSREGRNTFYAPAAVAQREFSAAASRIYGRPPLQASERILMAAIHRVPDRPAAREAMIADGWRFLGPATALRADGGATPLPAGCLSGIATLDAELTAAARDLWRMDALNAGYARFVRVAQATGAWSREPPEAVIGRVLLVHQFRRLALKDPLLPAVVLPENWRGAEARRLFDEARAALEASSERWLSDNGFRPQT
ncbi:MAG: PaaX family transcriptional regulator C-terminal domain-containing protein [Beijerinckiaceae bacterium]